MDFRDHAVQEPHAKWRAGRHWGLPRPSRVFERHTGTSDLTWAEARSAPPSGRAFAAAHSQILIESPFTGYRLGCGRRSFQYLGPNGPKMFHSSALSKTNRMTEILLSAAQLEGGTVKKSAMFEAGPGGLLRCERRACGEANIASGTRQSRGNNPFAESIFPPP